ncbi:uncharacterized protein LOC130445160 [Diorhabda sublineata]|uniref:uncharacterized protein LOC130445160 n=1 Tax=Diorhabda sublineata TaxID=1163346 RepID=UPI0024E0C315|nr:uncharacterized protein LOC130445160 [Diorhabda sublineata]
MLYRTLLLLTIYFLSFINCSEEMPKVFLTAAKNVPRIGRSNKDNADFEKFFLKASKSVPRIGRRDENPYLHYEEVQKEYGPQNNFKYPTWSEIADRYEYEPELFSNPQALLELEKALGDDPNIYDWDKVRIKRKIPGRFTNYNKPLTVYKM